MDRLAALRSDVTDLRGRLSVAWPVYAQANAEAAVVAVGDSVRCDGEVFPVTRSVPAMTDRPPLVGKQRTKARGFGAGRNIRPAWERV